MNERLFYNLQETLQTKHVMFVCAANSSRSPMAEGMLKHVLQQAPEPLRSLKVISSGLCADDGAFANDDAISALNALDIDISAHRSQSVTRDLIVRSLALFAMNSTQIERIKHCHPDALPADTYLMRELMPPPENGGVFDPGCDLESHIKCRDYMAKAIPSIVTFLSAKIAAMTFGNTDPKTLQQFVRETYAIAAL